MTLFTPSFRLPAADVKAWVEHPVLSPSHDHAWQKLRPFWAFRRRLWRPSKHILPLPAPPQRTFAFVRPSVCKYEAYCDVNVPNFDGRTAKRERHLRIGTLSSKSYTFLILTTMPSPSPPASPGLDAFQVALDSSLDYYASRDDASVISNFTLLPTANQPRKLEPGVVYAPELGANRNALYWMNADGSVFETTFIAVLMLGGPTNKYRGTFSMQDRVRTPHSLSACVYTYSLFLARSPCRHQRIAPSKSGI